MFSANSRYAKAPTTVVTLPDGRQVTAVVPPVPPASVALAGYHPRTEGERLDLVAARYLSDATLFWRLCDANGTVVPDALAARPLVGVPRSRSGA